MIQTARQWSLDLGRVWLDDEQWSSIDFAGLAMFRTYARLQVREGGPERAPYVILPFVDWLFFSILLVRWPAAKASAAKPNTSDEAYAVNATKVRTAPRIAKPA
jgi:hypothetical protein